MQCDHNSCLQQCLQHNPQTPVTQHDIVLCGNCEPIICILASTLFPGPTQLFIAYSTEKAGLGLYAVKQRNTQSCMPHYWWCLVRNTLPTHMWLSVMQNWILSKLHELKNFFIQVAVCYTDGIKQCVLHLDRNCGIKGSFPDRTSK